MARAGRKQKPGKRAKSGRPSRAGHVPALDRGSEWVQQQRERYGTNYNTALGRAFAAGLLGDETEALDRYTNAKRFARLYTLHISQDRYRCALDRSPRGMSVEPDLAQLEYQQDQQRWLFWAMDVIDATGCRPFVDQLLAVRFVDRGPYWLDNLLAGGRDPADVAVLKAAIKGIDAIVPVRVARIVAG